MKELRCVRVVLTRLVNGTRQWLTSHADWPARMARLQDQAAASQAQAPEPLMLFHRYISKIERAIERKLRQLQRR